MVLMNVFQRYSNPGPYHYRQQYAQFEEDTLDAEAIIIGTSHATHAIRPSLLDKSHKKFYNFSLNGASPEFFYNWYHELYKSRFGRPDYCIIAIDWFMFDEEWLHRKFEQDSEYFPRDVFWRILLRGGDFDRGELVRSRFPILKYRRSFLSSLGFKQVDEGFLASGFDRGFIPVELPFDSSRFEVKYETSISAKRQQLFQKLVHELDSSGTKLVFVITPEYNVEPAWYEQIESLHFVREVAVRYQIPILNFNTTFRSSINEDINCFSDWGHMNDSGSVEFSMMLADKISNLSNLSSDSNLIQPNN